MITAAQWKDAARNTFHRTAMQVLGLSKRSAVKLTLHSHPHTAAVSWQFMRDNNGAIVKAEIALFLPEMRPGTKLTKRDADALAGYWVHELCHVYLTDDAAWQQINRTRAQSFCNVVNGLEDIRIEREMIRQNLIPGASKVLPAITERAVWAGPITPQTMNRKRGLAAVLAYVGRAKVSGYDLGRTDQMLAALNPKNRALVLAVLAEVETAKSTQDIIDIADKMFRGGFKVDAPATPQMDLPQELNDLMPDEDLEDLNDQSTQGEGEAEQQPGTKSEESEEGEGEADTSGEAGQADQGETPSTGDTPGEDTDQGDDFATVTDSDHVETAEPDQGAKRIADDANGDPLDEIERHVLREGQSMRTPRLPEVERSPRSLKTYEELRGLTQGVGALKIQVRRLIQAPDRFGYIRNLDRGALDPRGLVRAKAGSRDVYRRRDEQEGHTAAVALVLDLSGSMYAECDEQAGMAINVTEACAKAGAQVEVWGFTGGGTLTCIKRASDTVEKVRGRLTASAQSPGSSTPLAKSIVKASESLALLNAQRRILFIMTDGGDNHGSRYVRTALRLANGNDQETVGVVITHGTDNPDHYGFDAATAAVACDAKELGGAVLKRLIERFERAPKVAA